MTPLQIETLCETIEKKWMPIVENGGHHAWVDCALCSEYQNCTGCPIPQFTGKQFCLGTPWFTWREATKLKLHNVQELAIRMLLFLVSLLPGESTYEQLREQVGV